MTDHPTIEKGIPVPKITFYKGRWVDLLLKMDVNDSFKVDKRDVGSLRTSIRAYILTHRTKEQWVVKKVNHDQWRCWRTK